MTIFWRQQHVPVLLRPVQLLHTSLI